MKEKRTQVRGTIQFTTRKLADTPPPCQLTRLPPIPDLILVGEIADLQAKKVIVVQGADRPIAVFAHGDAISAVDNRCPHLGFPLHRGTVEDGILTCHWHHARFDLASGCTFDLWADDVPRYEVVVRDGRVYVDLGSPRRSPRAP